MSEFLKVGGTAINLDRVTSVELNRRTQHPDKARHRDAPHKNGCYDSVRINVAGQDAPIDLFDDEAEAARGHFEEHAEDVMPKSKRKSPEESEADRIRREADAATGGARSGIIDSERLHAATSAGQDRVGAADYRPPADRTTPPPGTAPAAEIVVPERTAGLPVTPVEAKGLVGAAETVRADDERREREGKERTADLPEYPSDRSGEGTAGKDKDAATKLKPEGDGKGSSKPGDKPSGHQHGHKK